MRSTDVHLNSNAHSIAADHYLHWAAVLASAAYAWQVHGFLAGLATLIAVLTTIAVTNMILMAKSGNFRLIRLNRWFWVVVALLGIALTGAEPGVVSS